MRKYVDFHLHTYYSDGEDAPKSLIDKAITAKLEAIAITDHGTVRGIPEAIAYSKGKIEVIPGIELSCGEPRLGIVDIHILGLFIDPHYNLLQQWLRKAKKKTVNHKEAIVRRLNRLGFAISLADAAAFTKGEVGRPHIAKALIRKYPTTFKSVRQVFDEYLTEGRPAYVPASHRTTIGPVIDIIHQAGGVAILAHPRYFDQAKFRKVISLFTQQGGDGVEAYYVYGRHQFSTSARRINRLFRSIAQKQGLLLSGGSDYHGSFKPVKIGDAKVPMVIFSSIKKKAFQYRK